MAEPGTVLCSTLETPRLWLQPLTIADAGAIQKLFPVWEVVCYLADQVPWPYPDDGALTYVRDQALPAMERREEWHWTLRLKSDPETVIGLLSLSVKENLNRGFWLGVPWHHQGLMTEAVYAATDFWFFVLGFPVLRAPKAIANTASRRLSERSGMRVVATEEREFVSGRLPSEIWEISADEWCRLRAH